MEEHHIRNFSIIAHIDHGKSTLADRMLEVTHTLSEREMKDQVLDQMELERERGITIKMQPVRMLHTVSGTEYVYNLIDTPGHIDFSYEVSRALSAVEGVLLLVDATQGIQAQTLTTLKMAQELDTIIVPVISKIDSPNARIDEVRTEMKELLICDDEDILLVSGKTGEGVHKLLDTIAQRISPPQSTKAGLQALVFDFGYTTHRGIILYTRIVNGEVEKGENLSLAVAGKNFSAGEVGIFTPTHKPVDTLSAGSIGYIVSGIKEPGVVHVGDTVVSRSSGLKPLPGYKEIRPVVWAGFYPESADDFVELSRALEQLKLTDSSLSFEEEASAVLGRGFRCGFLGMLHLEIVTERLRREFQINLIVTSPSITYEVTDKQGEVHIIYTASSFPEYANITKIREPWVNVELVIPHDYVDAVMQSLYDFEAQVIDTKSFGASTTGHATSGRITFHIEMPLRKLMQGYFDVLKSITAGYGSLSYEVGEMREADVVELSVLVAEEEVPAFSRVVSSRDVERVARETVEKLYELLPRQQVKVKIQAAARGRVLSSKTLPALRKDVTAGLYGGDITRRRKLWEKQKKGKKRMQKRTSIDIPHDVFVKMIRNQ